MKKKLAVAGVFLLALAGIGYFYVPIKVLEMVTEYDPYTFEDVLQYDSMRADFGIGDASHPLDYGFGMVEDVDFGSVFDSMALNGWYIPAAAQGDRCLILVHGRTSNRLKPMKYLRMFRELQLDTDFNFFLPDLRNSGRSEPASTFMGYRFAEDLCSAMLALHAQKDQRRFVLYGFSMGAMAIFNVMGRPELQGRLRDAGIRIEMLITDSPLANVKSTLQENAAEMHLPDFLFDRTWRLYSRSIGGFGEQMNLQFLMQDNTLPWLILQSEDDRTTRSRILKEELSGLQAPVMPEVRFFQGPDHVRIYQTEETRDDYVYSVSGFFRRNLLAPGTQ